MPVSIFLSFFTYAAITAITPGPNNLLALSSACQYGLRGSSRLILGMCAGFAAVMLVCGGITLSLAQAVPDLVNPLTWAGVAYIFWLAWRIASSTGGTAQAAACPIGFWSGFFLQFANIKIILYGITAFSIFILPYTQHTPTIAGYSLFLAALGSGANLLWALAGKLLQSTFQRHSRVFNLVMAALLVGCGLQMVVQM